MADSRNTRAHLLNVNVGVAKGGTDHVRWHFPETIEDIEGAGIVGVESTD
jgi:hypothetical protein